MTRHSKELKPPPEVVEATQASQRAAVEGGPAEGDESAGDVQPQMPAEAEAATTLAGSPNLPRAIRNRLAHEEFNRTGAGQIIATEGDATGGRLVGGMARAAQESHEREVQKMHDVQMRYDRSHITAGKAGQGNTEAHSSQAINSNNREGGKGPHYSTRNAYNRDNKSAGKNSGRPYA